MCPISLALVNSAAVNVGERVTFQISVFVFFRFIAKSRIAGSYSSSSLVFGKPRYSFPKWLYPFTFPLTVYDGSLFPTTSPTFVICGLFDDSDRWEVVSHFGFSSFSSNNYDIYLK